MSKHLHSLRALVAAPLLFGAIVTQQAAIPHVHAATPTMTISPATIAPHGQVQITGTGFDPSTGGQQVMVNIALINSGGTVPLATVPTDAQGNIASTPITLPFTLDVGGNQITATEQGNTSITTASSVTGMALQPQLNSGQPLTAQGGTSLDVKGTGFAALDLVQVLLDGTPLAATNSTIPMNADKNGVLSTSVLVPQTAQPGAHTLSVLGQAKGAGQQDQASISLTIAPSGSNTPPGPTTTPFTATPNYNITVSPNPAVIGTSITGSARGFQPNEPVTFSVKYYDLGITGYAVQNSPTTADATGAATAVIHIPASADGSKPASVSATGITSNVMYTTNLAFTVSAQLTFSPTSAPPGTPLVIHGSGFVPNERLFVTTKLFTIPPTGIGIVDATGQFNANVTILPTIVPGSFVVAVSGSGGDMASAMFTVTGSSGSSTTTVQVTPSTSAPGKPVTLKGKGFGPQEALAVTLDGKSVTGSPALAPTDTTGAFTGTVTLPSTTSAGTHTLEVKGQTSGKSATVKIAITGTTPAPAAPLAAANQWYFAEGFTWQGPKIWFRETLTIMNTGNKATNGTLTYQLANGTTTSLPLHINAHTSLVEDVNDDIGPDQSFSIILHMDQPVVASRTITRTDAKKKILGIDYSAGQTTPSTTWLFAESSSSASFQPYLTVQNPSTTAIAATVTMYPSSGAAKTLKAKIVPFGRSTLNLRTFFPGKSFSIRLVTNAPVIAERVEYWGNGATSPKSGADIRSGTTAPKSAWYFGYAAVGNGKQAFLSVFNPNTGNARMQIRLFDDIGKAPKPITLTIGHGQRLKLNLSTLAGARPHSPVAVLLSADHPVLAEETTYTGVITNSATQPGIHIPGQPLAAIRWQIAGGDTGSYQETDYLWNTSNTATTITARFYGTDGKVVTATYNVGASKVIAVKANTIRGMAKNHGSVWSSTKNVKFVVVQVLSGKDGKEITAQQGLPG